MGRSGRRGDLTFSADKSVSAVWAVAGERLRTAIADAQPRRSNTRSSMSSKRIARPRASHPDLKRRSRRARHRPRRPHRGLFQHGTSRADDPQLHTHCTVMNVAGALRQVPRAERTPSTGGRWRRGRLTATTSHGVFASSGSRWSSTARTVSSPASRACRARSRRTGPSAPPRLRRSPATTALTSPPTRSCTRPPTTSPARPSATRAPMRRSAPGGGRRRKRSRSAKRSSQSYAMSLAVISRLSGCASSPPGSSNYLSASRARSRSSATPRWPRRFETPPRGCCTRMRPGPRSSGCFAQRRSFG